MTRIHHLLAGVLLTGLLLAQAAHAATRQLAGPATALTIDSPCARHVTVMPDLAAGAGVKIEATADYQEELDLLVLTPGQDAKLTVPDRFPSRCARPTYSVTFEPTLMLTVHVPAGLPLSIDDSGRADYQIGDIGGPLNVDLSGGAHVTAGGVAAFKLEVSGDGNVTVTRVSGPLQAEFSGHGTLDIAHATVTKASLDLSGKARVHIGDGTIATLSVEGSGVADVNIGASVGDASVEVSGVGHVAIAKVTGTLTKDISGVGSVVVGNQ
jgi:hypothetical protein